MLSYMKSWRNHQKCFGKSITLNFPNGKQEEVWLLITIYFCFFSFRKKRLWMPAKCFSNVTKTSRWKSHSFRNGAKNFGGNTWVPWKARFSSQNEAIERCALFCFLEANDLYSGWEKSAAQMLCWGNFPLFLSVLDWETRLYSFLFVFFQFWLLEQ